MDLEYKKKIEELGDNIIKWYDFKEDSTILICGEENVKVIESLAQKVKKVIILEDNENSYFEKRTNFIFIKNVSVFKGEIESFVHDTKFQYIFLMNNLKFECDDTKNVEILKAAQNLLTEDGTIFLAVNNCLSLRFLAQSDLLNPQVSGLTKQRIENILEKANVKNHKFYFPMPENECINVIFSEDYIPSQVDLDRDLEFKEKIEEYNFNDKLLLSKIIEKSKGDFEHFCGSFLVEISNDLSKVKAVFYNNMRKPEFRLTTRIFDEYVDKKSDVEKSRDHFFNIAKNVEIMKNININTLDTVKENCVFSKFVKNGTTLQDIFLFNYKRGDYQKLTETVDKYKEDLLEKLIRTDSANNIFEKFNIALSEEKINKLNFVKHGLIDLCFHNIFIQDGEFSVYDQEWYYENVPMEFILYRSIKNLSQVFNEERENLYNFFNLGEFIEEFNCLDNEIQQEIFDDKMKQYFINHLVSYDKLASNEIEQIINQKNEITAQYSKEQSDLNKELEEKDKEIAFKQRLIDSKEMLYSEKAREYNEVNNLCIENMEGLKHVQNELERKRQEVASIYAGEVYQRGILALQEDKKFYPAKKVIRGVKNIVKSIFRPIKRGVLSLISKAGNAVYDIYPVKSHKRKLKHKVMYSKKLAGLAKTKSYMDCCDERFIDRILMEDGTEQRSIKFQVELNKSIGIHLHLYYTDLLDEFYYYFTHIPYEFDLYVSVMKGADVKKIYKKFSKILNLVKLKVVETPNSGRDFGAMFVEFREDLKKYDYIMHVHSKKSLRVGEEQSAWRRYMLDYLLGSEERIMKNFYILEEMGYGMVYVDTKPGVCPFWAHTWLGEAGLAREILHRMNMPYYEEYLQFPAGSMFCAKQDALHQLFDIGLTWEDFGYEDGSENESNLAYVCERITGSVAINNGYNIAIYNPEEGRYRQNKGVCSLYEYFDNANKDSMIHFLKNQYDIITFDIFDTLITRNIYKPDDSFKIIDIRIEAQGIKVANYFETRKEAENNVRRNKNYQGDCNIHEIYEEFQKITGLTKEECDIIKQIEIDTEYELVIPRKEVKEMYDAMIAAHKKVILISDMYLTKDIIEKMLNKCGYYGWDELLVSSEIGYRKDNSTMWKYFFDKYGEYRTTHVGDSEYSDVHALVKMNRNALNIMNGVKLNQLMPQRYVQRGETLNLAESIMFGSIINRVVVNSPFAMYNAKTRSVIGNYFDYGYAVLGPVIFNYMLWIVKQSMQEKNGEVLLFSAREGYYLQKIYNLFKEKFPEKLAKTDDHYLYISRRAISVMTINSIEDIVKILSEMYYGTIQEVLYYRLNYKGNDFENKIISLPQDLNVVLEIVNRNLDEIMENARKERENYLKYIDSLNIDFENKRVSMLDLGYAGTAQYYLSKLLNKKITGKYFAVNTNAKPPRIGLDIFSCYNKDIHNPAINHNIIYKYSLLIEVLLTAPDGQFVNMDFDENGNIKPNFLYEPGKEEQMKKLDKIFEGVQAYAETMLSLLGEKVFEIEVTREDVMRCFEIGLKEVMEYPDLQDIFVVEDYYCSNAVVNAVRFFKNRKDKDWTYE